MNDQDIFRVNDLDGDEVVIDVSVGEKEEQCEKVAKKEVSTADPITTASEVVTTADVEVSAALTTKTTKNDELSLVQTLIEIKAANPKAIITTATISRIARKKYEVNISVIKEWDDVQAITDANRQLAEQLQAQEREQVSIEERSKLLAKLIESKRKCFAAKRAEEIRNKPPTKAQQKILMCTYMKNMKGYKKKDFKGKSFDSIKKMFAKVYKRVNTFVDMNTKIAEERLKKIQAEMRIEQYFLMTDYALKEVILNGDSPPPTRSVEGGETPYPPTTVEEKLARKNELKARCTLLMALPNEHQLKFNSYKTAKSFLEAIEKRFEDVNINYESQKIPTKKIGRNLGVKRTETIGFDKTKVDFYNCHRRGHFDRKRMASKHQNNRNRKAPRRTMPVEDTTSNALVS
nr:hypothetical protein [Tanacetum cinerariifolium]